MTAAPPHRRRHLLALLTLPTLLALAGLTLPPPGAAAPLVELNSASLAALDRVKGIGPELSERLLEERRRAAFADWADLMRRVPGIGPKRAARLSAAGLRVNGAPAPPRTAE